MGHINHNTWIATLARLGRLARFGAAMLATLVCMHAQAAAPGITGTHFDLSAEANRISPPNPNATPNTLGVWQPRTITNGPTLAVAPLRFSLTGLRRFGCVPMRLQSTQAARVTGRADLVKKVSSTWASAPPTSANR